jgi:hypothetical protein
MITIENLNKRPLSYSSLKEFSKSPAHYIQYLRKEFKPTPAMALGSLIHCMLLQPEELVNKFYVMPAVDKRTTEGKNKYAECVKESEGKEVVGQDVCNKYEHEWACEINGLPLRGFFDGEADDYILEIKTANDASPKTVINDFFNRSYHIQGGLYHWVSQKPIKYLIIETTSPYNVILADASYDYIKNGLDKAFKLVDDFKACMENDLFHMGYDYHMDGNFVVDLPSWVK